MPRTAMSSIRRTAAVLGVVHFSGVVLLAMQQPGLHLGIGISERFTVFSVQVFAALLGARWWRTGKPQKSVKAVQTAIVAR